MGHYEATVEERWAVTAHNLMNELAIIAGGVAVLRDGWQSLNEERRRRLMGQIEGHARAASEVLGTLARGALTGDPSIVAVA